MRSSPVLLCSSNEIYSVRQYFLPFVTKFETFVKIIGMFVKFFEKNQKKWCKFEMV